MKDIIIATCKTCGEKFKKDSKRNPGTKRMRDGLRSWNTVNCSKKCSKDYLTLSNSTKYGYRPDGVQK